MPEARTLLSVWAATVAAAPEALALVEGGTQRPWTRAELHDSARALAATLPDIRGRRVCFALPNGPGWFSTFIGLLLREATPVPLDPAEPIERQLAIARQIGASWVVHGDTLESTGAPAGRRTPPRAVVKLTSGSTGTPRALPFTHAQLLADGRNICSTMQIGAHDRNLAVIPFGHSYGLGNLVVPLLTQGTAAVCADTPLPHALATLATRHSPTVFPAVPALLRALAEADLPATAFASLRTVISAGSPLPSATARLFHERFLLKVHGFYGSSETGGIAYDRDGDDTLAGSGVGLPLDGVEVNPQPGGRIRVRSEAVLRRSGFVPADLARVEADGRIVLTGRAGRMIKVGGRRLDLGDLENTIRDLPDINDAFAMPHPDDPELIASVIATPLDTASLRALLRAHLSPWKVPRRIVAVRIFPLTPRGKPDTAALRALLGR